MRPDRMMMTVAVMNQYQNAMNTIVMQSKMNNLIKQRSKMNQISQTLL